MLKFIAQIFNLPAELPYPESDVFPVLDKFRVEPWFKYIYTNRSRRWDLVLPFAWIAKNIPPTAAILETGCGAGFNLLWLARKNFSRLFGSDLRPNYIKAAKILSQNFNLPIDYFVADGTKSLSRSQHYDAIIFLNWTFLLSKFSYAQIFNLYSSRLNSRGYFIFDVIDSTYNKVPNNQYLTSDWSKPFDQRKPSEYKLRASITDIQSLLAKNKFSLIKVIRKKQIIPKFVVIAQKN